MRVNCEKIVMFELKYDEFGVRIAQVIALEDDLNEMNQENTDRLRLLCSEGRRDERRNRSGQEE